MPAAGFGSGSKVRYEIREALMVQKLSRSFSAAVSDFRYDACDEHICLATNL